MAFHAKLQCSNPYIFAIFQTIDIRFQRQGLKNRICGKILDSTNFTVKLLLLDYKNRA